MWKKNNCEVVIFNDVRRSVKTAWWRKLRIRVKIFCMETGKSHVHLKERFIQRKKEYLAF